MPFCRIKRRHFLLKSEFKNENETTNNYDKVQHYDKSFQRLIQEFKSCNRPDAQKFYNLTSIENQSSTLQKRDNLYTLSPQSKIYELEYSQDSSESSICEKK